MNSDGAAEGCASESTAGTITETGASLGWTSTETGAESDARMRGGSGSKSWLTGVTGEYTGEVGDVGGIGLGCADEEEDECGVLVSIVSDCCCLLLLAALALFVLWELDLRFLLSVGVLLVTWHCCICLVNVLLVAQ